jgi:catalase
MQGEAVPVTARVSNGGGDPDVPDYVPDVRGLAVKLYLPDGARTDIVAQTSSRFPFATPDAFVEFLRAQRRTPAMAVKLPLALIRNPRAARALPATAQSLRPPVSYATRRYYAIHAFRFVDANGGSRYVRYSFVPEAGEVMLVFDPTRVVEGIECSDDPVLRFRHSAYSESVARRMAG